MKAKTIISYLSSIKSFHGLLQQNFSAFSSPRVKAALKGLENLELYKSAASRARKVMTLPILKLIGHEIKKSSWSTNSKRVLWTACTVAVYSSCRMGELLPKKESLFGPEDTLLWKDVRVLERTHVLIHIKTSKNNNKGGDFIDLFPTNTSTCPVSALIGLRDSLDTFDKHSPVFSFSSGKNLTPKEFNSTISCLLSSHLRDDSSNISGHSFRAAIPSALARFPELASSDEIMGWGRWRSDAFLSYTRLKVDQKRKIFSKILTVLSSQACPRS